MEIRYLISFEKVAKLRSFSKAAHELFISQPTITTHIYELESELKTILFKRYTHPIVLTESGEIFLNYAKHILLLINQAKEEVNNIELGFQGTLQICASESVTEWLTTYINSYKAKNPHININLSIGLSNITLEKVKDGEVQVGFIKQSTPTFSHSGLIGIEIGSDEGILVFSPQHYLARYEVIPKEVLQNNRVKIPIIIFGKQTEFNTQVQGILLKNNIKYDANVNINHSETIKLFLKKSNYIAIMPQGLVKRDLEEGSLISRKIKDFPKINRYTIMIYRQDAESKVLKKFINDFLTRK